MRHEMQPNDRITITLEDGVAQVRLVRADKMNALDPDMFAALIDAGHVLHDLQGLRCVVLSGEGRSFCAGLDLTSMANTARHDRAPLTERTHGNANHAPASRDAVAQAAGAGDRRGPRGLLWRRAASGERGGHPRGRSRCAAGGDGTEVGAGARHGRLCAVARHGARRCACAS